MAGGQPLTKWLRLRLKKRQQDRVRSAGAAKDEKKPAAKPSKDARKRKQGGTHLNVLEDKLKPGTKPSKDTRKRKQDRARSAAVEGKGKPGTKPPNDARKSKKDRPSSASVEDKLKPRKKASKDALTHASNKNMSVSSLKHISTVDVASKSSRAPSTKRNKKYRDIKILDDSSILDSISRVEPDRVSQFKGVLTMLTSCVSCKCENEFNEEEMTFETDTYDSKTLDSVTLGSSTVTLESRVLGSQTLASSGDESSSTETTSSSTESPRRVKDEPASSLNETRVRFPPSQEQSSAHCSSLKSFDEPSNSEFSEDEASAGRGRPNSVGFIPIDEGRAVNIIMSRYSSDLQNRSRSGQEDGLVRRSSTMDRIETLDYFPKKKDVTVSPRFCNRREWSTLTTFSFYKSVSSGEDFSNHEEDDIWKFGSLMRQGEPWMGW